jgi:hypothetical protein
LFSSDVEKFLVETLKSVKLDKSAKDGRDKLLERVRQMLDDIAGPSASGSYLDGSNASGGSFNTTGWLLRVVWFLHHFADEIK